MSILLQRQSLSMQTDCAVIQIQLILTHLLLSAGCLITDVVYHQKRSGADTPKALRWRRMRRHR